MPNGSKFININNNNNMKPTNNNIKLTNNNNDKPTKKLQPNPSAEKIIKEANEREHRDKADEQVCKHCFYILSDCMRSGIIISDQFSYLPVCVCTWAGVIFAVSLRSLHCCCWCCCALWLFLFLFAGSNFEREMRSMAKVYTVCTRFSQFSVYLNAFSFFPFHFFVRCVLHIFGIFLSTYIRHVIAPFGAHCNMRTMQTACLCFFHLVLVVGLFCLSFFLMAWAF